LFFQAEDGIRDRNVTGVQTCALPICGKHFEALFGTPIDIEFKKAIEMYDGSFCLAENKNSFKKHLENAYNSDGLTVIEVRTDRTENSEWHKELWNNIHHDILGDHK